MMVREIARQRLSATYERRDDRIRFLALEQNSGTAAAKNHGIAAAKGQYIAGMDSDDVSQPQRLEKQIDFLRAKPDIGVVGTCAPLTDAELQHFGRLSSSTKTRSHWPTISCWANLSLAHPWCFAGKSCNLWAVINCVGSGATTSNWFRA